jgi:hypothetical protein
MFISLISPVFVFILAFFQCVPFALSVGITRNHRNFNHGLEFHAPPVAEIE